jgi:hypothetical protein
MHIIMKLEAVIHCMTAITILIHFFFSHWLTKQGHKRISFRILYYTACSNKFSSSFYYKLNIRGGGIFQEAIARQFFCCDDYLVSVMWRNF